MRSLTKLSFCIVALLEFLYAQTVKVLAVRDGVWVEQFKSRTWITAKAGMELSQEDKIRLDKDGYLALILPNGKATEIKDAGIYSVKDIIYDRRGNRDTLVSRYSGYVLNQAIAYGGGRASGKTLGAVTRSTMAPVALIPKQTYFYADSVILLWDRIFGSEGYIIHIEDYSGQLLTSIVMPAEVQSAIINMRKCSMCSGFYYWSISTVKYPTIISQRYCFYILSPEEETRIKEEETLLVSSLDKSQAISYAILGSFYEEKKMYVYAFMAYDRAAKMQPDVPFYSALRDAVSKRE